MVDFRSGYIPPGVYVSQDTSATATAVGASPTTVLLVGPSLGYRTYTDYNTFTASSGAGSVFTLTQLGANTATVVVKDANGATVNSANYTVNTASGSGSSAVVTVTANNNTPLNQQLSISYQYTDSGFYALNQFGDPQSVFDVYGAPFDTSGNLQSALSLAAQVAFENGANILYCITLNPNQGGTPTLAQQYNNAYALSATNYDINLIVPVFDGQTSSGHPTGMSALSGYISGLVSHLQSCDTAGFPRNAILGVPESFDSSVTPDTIAQTINYRRVVFVWPNRMVYFNGFIAPPSTTVVGGSYLAAAAAGVVANNPTNQALTRQQIYSIAGISPDVATTMTTTSKNTWSSRGVCVLEQNRSGVLWFRHGVTTDMSAVTNREFSIVRCGDELFSEIQTSLETAQLVGSPITDETPLAVKGIVAGALETAMSTNTIQGYQNLAVRQQDSTTGDPSVIEVTFAYQPTYPLNYIVVTFTFDLTTGALTDTTDTAGTSESNGTGGTG